MKKFLIPLLLLSSCNLAPDYKAPDMAVPEAWKNNSVEAAPIPESEWWKAFGSDELSGFIANAITDNNDLLAASARVEQAQAAAKIAGAPLWPSVVAQGNAGRNFNNNSNAAGAVNSYQAGATVAYELDVFGKLRNNANAADAFVNASIYDREALRLSISAQIASGYFNVLSFHERVAIAENNLKNTLDILAVIQTRFDAGAISLLELSQQKTLAANQEATLANLKQQREIAQNSLAVLLGAVPQSFIIKDTSLDALTPPAVAPILPAELITRRPDIASLEAQLRAANFNIGAARAAFFPSFDVSASVGLAANPSSASASVLSGLAASIAAPLFTGGQLEGGLEQATARQKELAANYRSAVLTALGEVENALHAVETTHDRLESLTQAADAAKSAYDASLTRFDAGAIDYLTLLSTQNALFQAKDTLIQAKADHLSASVDLFKALGGQAP